MDATALNVAVNALAAAGVSPSVAGQAGGGAAETGADFAQMLASMMGTGALDSGLLNSGLFGSAGLSGGQYGADILTMLGGSSWLDLQSGMMDSALQGLLNAEKPLVTDPVLAQLMQMLRGTGKDKADGDELIALLERMRKRLLEMAQQNGADMAGQQTVALFAALMQDFMGVPLGSEAQNALSADGGQNLLQLMTQGDAGELLALLNGMKQDGGQASSLTYSEAAGQMPQTKVQPEAGAAEAQAGIAPAQRPNFQQTVRTVIERMEKADAEKAETVPEVDVDVLQQGVDEGLYLQGTAMEKGLAAAQAAAERPVPAATQLYNGLMAQEAAGREEVVVKLAPEELGEVTIRLTRTAEGTHLTIVAKNTETQQLLASQINDLQDKMQPYRVDVDSILTERQYEMLSYQQNFDGRQRQANSGQTAQGGNTGAQAETEAIEALEAAAGPARISTAGLDTYI